MIILTIALIGRINVGKSTLFNCLTRTKDALVSNFPGLTRDRRYGDVSWRGHKFIIIDTGGINKLNSIEVQNSIGSHINYQSYMAAEEADLILFIVDARIGALDVDYEIVKCLFKLNKKYIVVVNKVDGIDINYAMECFYSFGIKEIIPVSAFSGYGIKNLLKRIVFLLLDIIDSRNNNDFNKNVNNYTPNLKYKFFSPVKLAIVGRPNVGKSTFINCILNKERMVVYNAPGTTRDDIHIPFVYNGCKYIVIDTPGIVKRNTVLIKKIGKIFFNTLQIIRKVDVILLILDANDGIIDQDLTLIQYILNEGKSLVIAINKCDQLSANMRRRIKDIISCRMRFIFFVPLHFVSAIRNFGIHDTMQSIFASYECSIKRISANRLTKIMQTAVSLHSPPLVKKGIQVHLKYAHMGGNNPLIIVIHGNKVRYLSYSHYERYLVNYFINALCIIGTVVKIKFNEA